MNGSLLHAIQCAVEAGRMGLAELLLQQAAREGGAAECMVIRTAMDEALQAEASSFLRAVQAEMPRRKDAADLTLLLHYYETMTGLLEENMSAEEGAEIDDVSAALYREVQYAEQLIFSLAGAHGWELLADEQALFPEDERALFAALAAEHHEAILSSVQCVKEMPLVSIMIPAYNLPNLFARTMRSAAIQEWPNLEILVADNSTNEETAAVMERYADDPRVRYMRNRTAKSKAENFAVFEREARGEYLQWLMQDDILLPGKIARMAQDLMGNPSITLVASQRDFIDARGVLLDEALVRTVRPAFGIGGACAIFSGVDVGRAMVQRAQNIVGEPPAVLFRRGDLTHHYWRADCRGYRAISDVVMWLELLKKGDLLMYKEALSCYRRHGMQEGQKKDVAILSRIEWFRLAKVCYEEGVFFDEEGQRNLYARMVDEYGNRFHAISSEVGGDLAAEYEAWIATARAALTEG